MLPKKYIRELNRTVNGQLIDLSIRHAHYIASLEGQVANRALSFLHDDLIPHLRARLKRQLALYETKAPVGTWTLQRLRRLTAGSIAALQGGIKAAGDNVTTELKYLAIGEAQYNRAVLAGIMKPYIDWTPNLPSVESLNSIVDSRPFKGKTVGKWFEKLSKGCKEEFERQIKIGVASGETPEIITARILKAADYPKRYSNVLVRTAVNHISNESRMATYQANDDVLKGWKFVATLDSRTTDICASNDGLTFNLGEGPYPPLHHQCRSTHVGIVKSWAELGLSGFGLKEISETQRAALGGPVQGKINYAEWLKTQPLKIKQLRMGKRWGERFHRGEVTFQDYLDRLGGPKAKFKNAPAGRAWRPDPTQQAVMNAKKEALKKAADTERKANKALAHYRKMADELDRYFLKTIKDLRSGQ